MTGSGRCVRWGTVRFCAMLDDGSSVTASNVEAGGDRDLKASLSFLAGSPSEGYGGVSDMSTGFSLEHQVFSEDTVSLDGNVGYGQGAGAAILRTSYTHKTASGSEPTVALTVRRLAAPEVSFHTQALQAVSLTTTDDFNIGNVLELKFGSELQTVQFMGRFTSFQPFGTADLHLSPKQFWNIAMPAQGHRKVTRARVRVCRMRGRA